MNTAEYKPETCVWELTTECNLSCRHCASSCTEKGRKDELSKEEAAKAAEQIADLGVKWVSLTGGELFTSKVWYPAAKLLKKRGVHVHMITNGTLICDNVIQKIKDADVSMVSVSLDGTKEIHDFIRGDGVYDSAYQGMKKMQKAGIRTGCITSVMKQNLSVLKELKEELIRDRVQRWQIQMAVPEGNMRLYQDSLLEPAQMTELIDMAYEMSLDGRIHIILPDNVGYYTKKEMPLRQYGDHGCRVWKGCNAGIRSFGILSNGDVVGCTSMRGNMFAEGNLLSRSLKEIWEDPDSFLWRRRLTKEMLGKKCSGCIYASMCLGGCSNTRYTVQGSVYSDNPYCAYAAYQDHESLNKIMKQEIRRKCRKDNSSSN